MRRVLLLNDLAVVSAWEVRRQLAGRMPWLVGALTLALCVGIALLKHSWGRPVVDGQQGETILILGTTRVGIPYLMIEGLFVLFGPLIPFVATEGVAHDLRQRTHELVMTTPIPGVLFVWGRFAAVLLASFVLDLLLLASTLVVGAVLHATNATYPLPDLALVLGVWSLAIVPGTLLLSSVSFALGTLLPRIAGVVKVVPVVGWIGLVFLSDVVDHGGTWFTSLNPTSYGIVRVQVDRFLVEYQSNVAGVADATQRAEIALRLQQMLPDLGPFIIPHLALVCLSLLLVGWTSLRFRRFVGELG